MSEQKELVRRLYTRALTVEPGADNARAASAMQELLADDFESINTAETKGKEALIRQVQGFWKLIPDLTWEPQEMLQDGDQVVVRSVASGSPKGDFMGMALDGTRSFRMMTIDIHTVERGRIRRIHHIEEWTTAIKQLKA
jgi:predicted ester cyclase